MRQFILNFVNNNKDYPFIAGLSSGVYALLYLYDKNFTLVNSWNQFIVFVLSFCIAPGLLTLLLYKLFEAITWLKAYKKYVIPVLNLVFFLVYIVLVTQGFHKKKLMLSVVIIALVLGVLLYKYIKKIIVFQLLLSCFLIAKLIPSLYNVLTYSYNWQDLEDDITEVQFAEKPNIYYLQPDGYVGFKEMKTGYYNHNNDEFQSFLQHKKFKIYNNFRSNYTSTLTSNSSMFSMKHHYYGADQNHDEQYNARSIIAGNNAVIDILQHNNYKTNLILDVPYLLVNRPTMNYDYCNINYNDIPYLTRGFGFEKDTKNDLFYAIEQNKKSNNFYFVRQPKPGHISTTKSQSRGKEEERNVYLEDLKTSNNWLKEIVVGIEDRDPNAMIIILSDHGGFVGFDFTRQSKTKGNDADLVTSMFSSLFAVKWPQNDAVNYDENLKSSINVFRVVFSYLSKNKRYLEHLEQDESVAIISEGASPGVYELIDNDEEVVFNKFTD